MRRRTDLDPGLGAWMALLAIIVLLALLSGCATTCASHDGWRSCADWIPGTTGLDRR